MKMSDKTYSQNQDLVKEEEVLLHRAWHSRKAMPLVRVISITVAMVFFLQQVVYARGETRISVRQPLMGHRMSLDQVSIPRDVAITKDINRTDSEKLIINIKDVHDNYGAQGSIVSVLENLLLNYDVRFVGVEGSEGYIDTSIISAFPDERAKKMAVDYLMRCGKISAGEFFAALSDTPVTLYGIDDSELYVKNYNSFLNLLEYKKQNLEFVDTVRKTLFALEDHIFSQDLKALNRNSILNGNGQKRFTKRWEHVKEIGLRHGVRPAGYRNIDALARSVDAEKTIDYEATNSERDELLDLLTKRLKRDRLEELVLKSLAFRLGRISKSQFYSYLLAVARAENIDRLHYKHVERFCGYVTLYESIDIARLMDEIDDYECGIREKLFRNGDERELIALFRNIEILHNLYDIRLTSGQLRHLTARMDDFSAEIFLNFIRKQYVKYNIPIPAELADAMQVFERLPEAVTFYEAATARNREMVENTIERMKESGVNVAAVITGGFHTRGITDILKADRISYLILLPRFNAKTGKRPYITILTNKAGEYRHYVESGDYLAVTSFFAMKKWILNNSGMTDQALRTMTETVALMMAANILNYMEKGIVNSEVWARDTGLYLNTFRNTQERLVKEGLITEGQAEEATGFLEGLLARMTVREDSEGVKVYLATSGGNFMYSVSLAEKQEGDTEREVVLTAYDAVPSEVIDKIKIQRSVIAHEAIAGKAAEAGERLFEDVQKMKVAALERRLGRTLSEDINKFIDRESSLVNKGEIREEVDRLANILGISTLAPELRSRIIVDAYSKAEEMLGAGIAELKAAEPGAVGLKPAEEVVSPPAGRQVSPAAARAGETDFRIIAAAYNEGAVIEEALERALKAGYIDRLVIVNDGSTDATGEILDRYGKYGLTVIHKENTGKVDSIRHALAKLKEDGSLPAHVITTDADSFFSLDESGEQTARLDKEDPDRVVRKLRDAIDYAAKKNLAAVALDIVPTAQKADGVIALMQQVKWRYKNSLPKAMTFSVAGAGGVYRSAALIEALTGHSGKFSAEDTELISHIRNRGGKTGKFRAGLQVKTDIPRSLEKYLRQYKRYGRGILEQIVPKDKVTFSSVGAGFSSIGLAADAIYGHIDALLASSAGDLLSLGGVFLTGTAALTCRAVIDAWKSRDMPLSQKIKFTLAAPFWPYFELAFMGAGVTFAVAEITAGVLQRSVDRVKGYFVSLTGNAAAKRLANRVLKLDFRKLVKGKTQAEKTLDVLERTFCRAFETGEIVKRDMRVGSVSVPGFIIMAGKKYVLDLEAPLGGGGFGVAYKATCKNEAGKVVDETAVKILKPGETDYSEIQFFREYMMMKKLRDNDGVVKALGMGTYVADGRKYYYMMQELCGSDLDMVMEEKKYLVDGVEMTEEQK